MGIDLILKFSPWEHEADCPSLYTSLNLRGRDYDLWDRLQKKALPHPGTVRVWKDEGCVEASTDQYGERLTWLSAFDLGRMLPSKENPDGWGQQDLAVFDFIRALPSDKKIFLWWH